MERTYFIYVMSSSYGILYVGATGELFSRVQQHKSLTIPGFTQKYKCTKLVYYEVFDSIITAMERERQLKKWNRKKKEKLINTMNPSRRDLAEDFDPKG